MSMDKEYMALSGITNIPIRPDKTVLVSNLPHDLSTKEANKICNIIKLFVNDIEQPKESANDQ